MKLSKKILAAMSATALLATASFFTSCSDEEGEGDTSGSKTSTTMTLTGPDGTTNKDSDGNIAAYSRYFSQLGSKNGVAAFTTKVTINKAESTYTSDSKNAVVGMFFAENAYKDDSQNEFYDMVVFGFKPADGKAYVEHYNSVEKNSAASGYTTAGALQDTGTYALSASDKIFGDGSWAATTSGTNYATDSDGNIVFNIEVQQSTTGVYKVYMYKDGGSATTSTLLGTWTATSENSSGYATKEITVGSETKTLAIGGIGVYGNAPVGTKIVALYETSKDSITGSFQDETVEE
nr:hypothetical protein [Treponema sp.]